MIKLSILELGIFFYIFVIGHYIYYPFILRNPKQKKGIDIGLIAKVIKDQNFKSYAYWLKIYVFISNHTNMFNLIRQRKGFMIR